MVRQHPGSLERRAPSPTAARFVHLPDAGAPCQPTVPGNPPPPACPACPSNREILVWHASIFRHLRPPHRSQRTANTGEQHAWRALRRHPTRTPFPHHQEPHRALDPGAEDSMLQRIVASLRKPAPAARAAAPGPPRCPHHTLRRGGRDRGGDRGSEPVCAMFEICVRKVSRFLSAKKGIR